MNDVLKPQELADLFGVDTQTILTYIKQGKIKAIRFSQRTIRIPKQEVAYLFKTTRKEGGE
jgi:excisionase family DNA binding protein